MKYYKAEVTPVVFKSRQEASDVILALVDIIDRYGFAYVNDYYDLLGILVTREGAVCRWNHLTPNDYTIEEVADGYKLTMPKATDRLKCK